MSVVVEVGHDHGEDGVEERVAHRGLKGSVAVAEKHFDRRRVGFADDDVFLAVAAQIGNRYTRRSIAREIQDRRCLRSAVTVSKIYPDIVVAGIGDSPVRLAVTVQITGGDGVRDESCRHCRTKIDGGEGARSRPRRWMPGLGVARSMRAGQPNTRTNEMPAIVLARTRGIIPAKEPVRRNRRGRRHWKLHRWPRSQ